MAELRWEAHERIRALINRSGRLLDSGCYDEFVGLFAAQGQYAMDATSAEIGKPMTWLALDRAGLQALFKEYPEHVRDLASRLHLVSPEYVHADEETATAFSTFAVFRTELNGESALYAIGRYEDEFVFEGTDWKLKRRRVLLDTRRFVTPTPLPL
ncbi:MAG: aromatic-ring-hydroxylating dioxygenase subunit beta [Betaproteobacteria bacterium]